MAFIIAGHQRSGTTLLRQVCQTHPQLELTREFGAFYQINIPLGDYRRFIMNRWWKKRNAGLWPTAIDQLPNRRTEMLHNLLLVLRYLRRVNQNQHGLIDAEMIEQALQSIYQSASLVGDKFPDYWFKLDNLTQQTHLQCALIYRDPRDMVASMVAKVRTAWRQFSDETLGNPTELATRWVNMMLTLERNADRLFIVRYEDFVTNPRPIVQRLGEWLNIDPAQFNLQQIHAQSIGKHRQALTQSEIAAVVDVAGSTMQRYGYNF